MEKVSILLTSDYEIIGVVRTKDIKNFARFLKNTYFDERYYNVKIKFNRLKYGFIEYEYYEQKNGNKYYYTLIVKNDNLDEVFSFDREKFHKLLWK